MAKNRKANGQFIKGTHWRKPQKFREKEWLSEQYEILERSANEIAQEFGVTDIAIYFWLRRHGIKRRTISQARKIKHWGQTGSDNPMWNKLGELNPNWRGGVTPERQGFYVSMEWKKVCSFVWKRDQATCQRCNLMERDSHDMPFHVHHIKSFSDKELRAEPTNLILLCEVCHHFVHSRKNINHAFISEE